MNEYIINSTGNLLSDALCSLGLFRLILMADPSIKVECSLGSHKILRIRSLLSSKELEEGILNSLKKLVEDEWMSQRLGFRVNTGRGRPSAIEELRRLVGTMKTFSLDAFRRIIKASKGKAKKENLETFYLSLCPIYGKGHKKYDGEMDADASARASKEIVVSYMVGLANTICWEVNGKTKKRMHLALIPPPGKLVNEDYLRAIVRVNALYSTEESIKYIAGLGELPRLALPLAILSKLDLGIMVLFEHCPPGILIFDVEIEKGGGETSRLYEYYDTAAALRFLLGLGERMLDAKEYLSSLVSVHGIMGVRGTELQGMIEAILLELSLAIINSDPDGAIRALFESMRLKDKVSSELKRYASMIHLPAEKTTSAIVSSLQMR